MFRLFRSVHFWRGFLEGVAVPAVFVVGGWHAVKKWCSEDEIKKRLGQ